MVFLDRTNACSIQYGYHMLMVPGELGEMLP